MVVRDEHGLDEEEAQYAPRVPIANGVHEAKVHGHQQQRNRDVGALQPPSLPSAVHDVCQNRNRCAVQQKHVGLRHLYGKHGTIQHAPQHQRPRGRRESLGDCPHGIDGSVLADEGEGVDAQQGVLADAPMANEVEVVVAKKHEAANGSESAGHDAGDHDPHPRTLLYHSSLPSRVAMHRLAIAQNCVYAPFSHRAIRQHPYNSITTPQLQGTT